MGRTINPLKTPARASSPRLTTTAGIRSRSVKTSKETARTRADRDFSTVRGAYMPQLLGSAWTIQVSLSRRLAILPVMYSPLYRFAWIVVREREKRSPLTSFRGAFSLTKTATGILFKFSNIEDYQAVYKKGFHKVTGARFYKKVDTS